MRDLFLRPLKQLKAFFWPIEKSEYKKFVPMLIMLFCICFNLTLVRNLKDSLLVTANAAGAAILPFVKTWGVLPAAVISAMLFTFLSNHFSRRAVFHIVLGTFLSFFLLFALFLYPHRDALQPCVLSDYLEKALPKGFIALISMIRHWPLTLFYIMAEIWSSLVLTVVFWGFANEVTKITEAKRFYSILSLGASTSPILAGQLAVFLSRGQGSLHWEAAVLYQTMLVLTAGVIIIVAFNWMMRHGLDKSAVELENASPQKKQERLSFRESILYIARSKHLLAIATLVLAYNLVISLVEIVWKEQVRLLYPQVHEYNYFMNNLTSIMGIIATLASVILVGVLNRISWTKTALITPFVLLITSAIFFMCLLCNQYLSPKLVALTAVSPLAIAVFVGAAQNCFSKGAKYSLFDATKEMAFIPLDPEHKLKGKAAIDGIGSRLGKSGASCIHQGMYFIFYSIAASVPYVAVLLLGIIFIWVTAVFSLGKQLEAFKEPQPTS